MKYSMAHCCLIGLALFARTFALAQAEDAAQRVYSASQESVFLVYLNDSSGSPTALGTAFLIAPHTLITNAHVADAGSPVLAVGPVRIPLKVLRTDEKNDLAVMSVAADLTSKPLKLASENVAPGEQIFAIGNPEGLEKTISQGIVAGLREADGRKLIQITSPISHGSSGGPILNVEGEVIGVAVGMLEDGQNLNFAVPVNFVKALLANEEDQNDAHTNLSAKLELAKTLMQKREKEDYSADPQSDYQKQGEQMLSLVKLISSQSEDDDALATIACMGTKDLTLGDEGIRAAKKLAQKNSSVQSQSLLAYVLYDRSIYEGLMSSLAKEGSEEQTAAQASHVKLLSDAGRQASIAAKRGKSQDSLAADFILAKSDEELGKYSEAIDLLAITAMGAPNMCGNDLGRQAFTSLVSDLDKTGQKVEAEKWFRRYAQKYDPSSYDWDAEGDRRNAANDPNSSAEAYERAAGDNDYDYDFCYAAAADYMQTPTNGDAVLADGRKCIDASVKDTAELNQKQFKHELPFVYRFMAEVLQGRGVDQPALQYIKEALAAKPDDPFSLIIEADIFEDLQSYPECISAAQAAIAASDGKYASMSFRLGSCYFDAQNWSMAAASFQRAADADKTDAAAAFNLGLSFQRQGFGSDARVWFSEALKRNPDPALREKIVSALQ